MNRSKPSRCSLAIMPFLLLLSQPVVAATPVIAELFTSQSCSSCPPAERLLAELTDKQDVAGVEVIAVAEHVDYWNYLDWHDRFSSPYFSDRQRLYALRRGDGRVYTPQLVINGSKIVVGSRETKVRRALRRAAAISLVEAKAMSTKTSQGIRIEVKWPDGPARQKSPLTATFFILEDHISTNVRSGENRGRHLTHTAVARAWDELALSRWPIAKTSATLSLPADVKATNARVLVLLQETSGQVLGFARGDLPKD